VVESLGRNVEPTCIRLGRDLPGSEGPGRVCEGGGDLERSKEYVVPHQKNWEKRKITKFRWRSLVYKQ